MQGQRDGDEIAEKGQMSGMELDGVGGIPEFVVLVN